jgi:hypothetical protein
VAAQVARIELANIDAANSDGPALDIVKPQQQTDERGLAGAGVTDRRDGLAGGATRPRTRRWRGPPERA